MLPVGIGGAEPAKVDGVQVTQAGGAGRVGSEEVTRTLVLEA
jgi:hypothetical protein